MLMATTTFTKKSLGLETNEPALTPPPAKGAQTNFAKKPKLGVGQIQKTRHPGRALDQMPEVRNDGFRQGIGRKPEGLPEVRIIIFPSARANASIPWSRPARLRKWTPDMTSVDPLKFR